MKKLIILTIIILGFHLSNAQTEKGNFILGVSNANSLALSYVFSEQNTDNIIFNISPSLGYFIKDDFNVGIKGSFFAFKSGDNKLTIPSVGVFSQYYFPVKKIKFFVEAGVNFSKEDETTFSRSSKSLLYQVGSGIKLFLAEKLSFDFGLTYYHLNTNYSNLDNFRLSSSVSNSISLRWGASLYLGKKKEESK